MSFKTSSITGKPFPTLGPGWSNKIEFSKEGISTVPDATGVYLFYDRNNKPIYIGRSIDREYSGLRHRLQSYHEVDDFDEHPTKKALRPHINSFRYKETTEAGARELEMKLKQFTKYNADNKINEMKKHNAKA